MRRLNLVALLGVVMVAVGCGGGDMADDMATTASTINIRSVLDTPSDSRLVATMRGPGQIGYLTPVTRRDRNEIVTTFRIKNVSTGALAGFKVNEFWYDGAGDTVTGDSFRMRRPFLVDEIIEVELRVPQNSRMENSNYEFTHQNGVVEASLFDEMEAPPAPEEDEDTEESDAAETPTR